MILNVSGRCDIVAFYCEWFINRYRAGYVDVRNPFNKHLVSRINFSDVDAILFCTKNPLPIIPYLTEIKKPFLFHVTLTGYQNDIEMNVIDKKRIIECIKEISKIIGKNRLYVRYDPIFISEKYNVDYHIKAFSKLCKELNGYVEHIIISFMDEYKNVIKNKNILKYRNITNEEYKKLALNFGNIAKSNNMTIQTCFEDMDFTNFGFIREECLSKEIARELTGKEINKKWKARKEGKCNCIEMVDIGAYNSCNHLCKYCYANYDENQIIDNIKKHDKNSSLLIGELESDDIIKVRK